MLDRYKILTVTHKRTNLKHISDFVIKVSGPDDLKPRLEMLKQHFGLNELLYLSTCNRVMYFFETEEPLDDFFVSHFFQFINPELSLQAIRHLDETVLLIEGRAALEHLYEVAASIDSLVIGERQILGQLREAYDQCRRWGLTGDYLRLALQYAVAAAKAVYSQTRIGDKPISIVSLAVQKILRAKLPKDARILLVGAGQTNQLVAKFLVKHQFNQVTVFNRTMEKAEKLAESFQSEAFRLSALADYQRGFDCLVVCTGATEPVITAPLYKKLLGQDAGPKVVVDLSIPHNVAPEVPFQFPVHYIEIEGLRQLAKENLAFREQEVTCARKLLHQHLEEFPGHLRQRHLERAMSAVPAEIKAVKVKAMNEVFRKDLEQLDQDTRELVEKMLTYMEKKCIGIPMKAAREVIL